MSRALLPKPGKCALGQNCVDGMIETKDQRYLERSAFVLAKPGTPDGFFKTILKKLVGMNIRGEIAYEVAHWNRPSDSPVASRYVDSIPET